MNVARYFLRRCGKEDHCIYIDNGRLVLKDHGPCNPDEEVALHAMGGPKPSFCSVVMYWWRHFKEYPFDIHNNVNVFGYGIPSQMVQYRTGVGNLGPGYKARRARKLLRRTLALCQWPIKKPKFSVDFQPGEAQLRFDNEIDRVFIVIDHVHWLERVYNRGMAIIDNRFVLSVQNQPYREGGYGIVAARLHDHEGVIPSPGTAHHNGYKWELQWKYPMPWHIEEAFLNPWG